MRFLYSRMCRKFPNTVKALDNRHIMYGKCQQQLYDLEKEGKGYVVASLGTDSGYVPYTAFSAKQSYIDKNPEIIQGFTNALQKGINYVQNHTPEEIAKIIEPQFKETDLDTITTIVTRYYEQDTWKDNLVFEEESFQLLQDILKSAGELTKEAPYEDLVITTHAENAK